MFKTSKPHRILALLYIFVLLFYTIVALDYYSDPPLFGLIGMGAIASSTFILVTQPQGKSAEMKNILICYAIAIIIGTLFQQIMVFFEPEVKLHLPVHFQLLAVLAVLSTIVIFIRLNIEHPPAVGMTLALVLESWHYMTVIILISAVLGLLLIPWLLFFKRR